MGRRRDGATCAISPPPARSPRGAAESILPLRLRFVQPEAQTEVGVFWGAAAGIDVRGGGVALLRRKSTPTTRPRSAPTTSEIICAWTRRFMPHWIALGASKVMVRPPGGGNPPTNTGGARQAGRTTPPNPPGHIQGRSRPTPPTQRPALPRA